MFSVIVNDLWTQKDNLLDFVESLRTGSCSQRSRISLGISKKPDSCMVHIFSTGRFGAWSSPTSASFTNLGCTLPISPRPAFHSCQGVFLVDILPACSKHSVLQELVFDLSERVLKDQRVGALAVHCQQCFVGKVDHHVHSHLFKTKNVIIL